MSAYRGDGAMYNTALMPEQRRAALALHQTTERRHPNFPSLCPQLFVVREGQRSLLKVNLFRRSLLQGVTRFKIVTVTFPVAFTGEFQQEISRRLKPPIITVHKLNN